MKTIQFLTITALLVTVTACSKQDNPETLDPSSTQTLNSASDEKTKPVMPPQSDIKPNEMLPNEIKAGDTTTVIEQNNSGRKVIFWYDPMLADRHFSKSGPSPFMDMQLAPQYADDGLAKDVDKSQ